MARVALMLRATPGLLVVLLCVGEPAAAIAPLQHVEMAAEAPLLSSAPPSSQQAVPNDLIEETPDPDRFVPLAVGNYFTCDIPPDWMQVESSLGLPAEEKKTYGVVLQGPWRGEIPVRISIFYYAEGNLLYSSADHYLRLFSQPALGVALEGSSYGPVVPATVSGRAGMFFERLKNEYVPMQSSFGSFDQPAVGGPMVYERREMMARPVPVREQFALLPAVSGFYALRYSAPAENFEEFLPFFEKVMATFHARR